MFSTDLEQHDDRAQQLALECLVAGVKHAHPQQVIDRKLDCDPPTLTIDEATYDLSQYANIYVLGGGNAAGYIAAAVEQRLGTWLTDGVVITDNPVETDIITTLEGSHPIPSQRGVENTQRLRNVAQAADDDDLVLFLIAGGGSALMTAPAADLTLADMQETTAALVESGATIDEINAVRKHLSTIKGGQLAVATAPAEMVGLLFSDVVGDDPATVASGPTAPDNTTFADAHRVLETYELTPPPAVQSHLQAGMHGDVAETPRAEHPAFTELTNHILVTGRDAVHGAAARAEAAGMETLVLSASIRGEAREAALSHVAILEEIQATGDPVEPPVVVVSGGETTVTIQGDGDGGPNQEFALSAARELPAETVLACIDTDGIDGATDAAGALVDATTVDDAHAAQAALANNDAYTYLADQDRLLKSGPTKTNVNDLRVAVVGPVRDT